MRITKRLTRIDRTQRIRYAAMVFGILALAPPVGFVAQAFGSSSVCGNLCPRMAIGTDFVSELSRRTVGVTLLFLWVGSTFFFGRWMCSHVCPVGGLTEFGSKLVPSRLKVDYPRLFDAPLFRYGFLGAFILLPAVGYASICCGYCNWSAIPELFGALFVPRLIPMLGFGSRIVSMVIYGGLLGVLARDGRGHCHLACPVGALDSIANAVGARLPFTMRERIQLSKCSGCGVCATHCPTWAISVDKNAAVKAKIDYHRCTQCRLCESKCARGAISYGTPLRSKETDYVEEPEPVYTTDSL